CLKINRPATARKMKIPKMMMPQSQGGRCKILLIGRSGSLYQTVSEGHCRKARKNENAHPDKPSGHFTLATSYSRTAYRRTTIGAAAFHCRVRNGNGWDHCATVTRGPSRAGGSALRADSDLWRRCRSFKELLIR